MWNLYRGIGPEAEVKVMCALIRNNHIWNMGIKNHIEIRKKREGKEKTSWGGG